MDEGQDIIIDALTGAGAKQVSADSLYFQIGSGGIDEGTTDPLTGQSTRTDEIAEYADTILSGNSPISPGTAADYVSAYGLAGAAVIGAFGAAAAGLSAPWIIGGGLAAAGASYLTGYGVSQAADNVNTLFNEGVINVINDALSN